MRGNLRGKGNVQRMRFSEQIVKQKHRSECVLVSVYK